MPQGAAAASCEIDYAPVIVGSGSHTVTGSYGGDQAHKPSQGSDQIAVTLEDPVLDQTTTTLVCTPDVRATSEVSNCLATVRDDADPATTPTGRVEFESNGVGAFATAATCVLTETVAGEASCAVDYTPVLPGTGIHKVFATYGGDAATGSARAATRSPSASKSRR